MSPNLTLTVLGFGTSELLELGKVIAKGSNSPRLIGMAAKSPSRDFGDLGSNQLLAFTILQTYVIYA
jgi:hypothetical protein